jgi:hypothetical protein
MGQSKLLLEVSSALFDKYPGHQTAINSRMITVSPLIWRGFKAILDDSDLTRNCASPRHPQAEIKRESAFVQPLSLDCHIVHA